MREHVTMKSSSSTSAPRRGGQDSDIYCSDQDSDVSVQQRTGIRITMHKNKQTAAQKRKFGGRDSKDSVRCVHDSKLRVKQQGPI